MSSLVRVFALVLGGLAMVCFLPAPAFGYLDPASGSLIAQVIAAAVLTGLLFFKRAWLGLLGRCRNLWSRLRNL